MVYKEAEFKDSETFDIDGVEIFSVGTWNGDKYTEKDLDDMVTAFDELQDRLKPFIKLGHSDKQKMLQKDGLPSAGWITGLKREGDKLIAAFKGIPKKIKELIEKKAYGRFSSEIYWDLKIDDKKYKRVLRAVALLGADTPAVQNLDDFITLYTEENLNYEKIKNYYEVEKMDEKIYEDLKTKVKEYEEKEKTYADEIVQHKETIVDLEGQIKTLAEQNKAREAEQKENEIKQFIDEQVKEIRILPSQVEKYTKLARKDFESVKELMKDMPKLVVDTEESKDAKKPKEYSKMNDEEKDEYLADKVAEYAKENKVSYKEAYGIVVKELEEK